MAAMERSTSSFLGSTFLVLVTSLVLGACSTVGVGVSVPIGVGNVGIGVRSDGRVSGGVGVGRGGVGVGVGGSTRLPPQAAAPEAVTATGTPASAQP